MPRTEEANLRIREEQRAKILHAATLVFARKGLAATMAEVAAAAGVSYGLAYRYFTSKEALLIELVEKALSDSLRTIEQIRDMAGTPGERLHFLLAQILKGLYEHPEFILLVQQLLGNSVALDNPPEPVQSQSYRLLSRQLLTHEATRNNLRELAQKQSQVYRAVMRQLIVEGQAAGEVAGDNPDQLVAVVTACVAGLSQASTWQSSEQFRKTFPAIEIILRVLNP